MIRWNNKYIPALYLLFYKFLKEKATNNVFIPYSLAKEHLSRMIHNIPRTYYYIILQEMEELGLIRKIGNRKNFRYEFIGKDVEKLLEREDFLTSKG